VVDIPPIIAGGIVTWLLWKTGLDGKFLVTAIASKLPYHWAFETVTRDVVTTATASRIAILIRSLRIGVQSTIHAIVDTGILDKVRTVEPLRIANAVASA